MHRLRTALIGAVTTCLVLPLGVGSVAAAVDPDDVTVLADGLDNPRGLAFSRSGDLYVAQSGAGGDGPCFAGAEGPTCLGPTGAISKLQLGLDRHGHQHGDGSLVDVVTGLPSLGLAGTGDNAIGPSDVAFDSQGRLLATIGLGADPGIIATDPGASGGGLGGSDLARQLASVNWVDVEDGAVEKLADIAAFESAENPDQVFPDLGLIDTNPYAIAARGNKRVVADAGGNSLLQVDRDGSVDVLAVFESEAPVQNPFAPPGEMVRAQPVPNAVTPGPDGAFYVGQLTGFPFTTGTATVWRVKPGQAPTVYADGFTHIIDLAFTDDGDLLVLEIARTSLFDVLILGSGDWTGELIQVDRKTGQHTTLLTDPLFAPGGLAVRGDHAYIANRSIVAGEGEIIRVPLG